MHTYFVNPTIILTELADLYPQLFMPTMITYGLTITAVKISILLLYRRIFDTAAFKKVILVVGTLCVAWLFADIFGMLFFCSPMSAFWDLALIFSNHCRDIQAMLYGITISNMFLDIILLCMPLPMIWKLALSPRKKVEVGCLFLIGGLCVSLYRLGFPASFS